MPAWLRLLVFDHFAVLGCEGGWPCLAVLGRARASGERGAPDLQKRIQGSSPDESFLNGCRSRRLLGRLRADLLVKDADRFVGHSVWRVELISAGGGGGGRTCALREGGAILNSWLAINRPTVCPLLLQQQCQRQSYASPSRFPHPGSRPKFAE